MEVQLVVVEVEVEVELVLLDAQVTPSQRIQVPPSRIVTHRHLVHKPYQYLHLLLILIPQTVPPQVWCLTILEVPTLDQTWMLAVIQLRFQHPQRFQKPLRSSLPPTFRFLKQQQ